MPPRRSTRAGLDTRPLNDHGRASVWEAICSLTEVVREHVIGVMPPRDKKVMHEYRTVERFCCMRPPKFHDTSNPMEAKAWLMQIKKIFKALNCPEDQKVNLATFILRGEAEHW